jgi:hypothetical protein
VSEFMINSYCDSLQDTFAQLVYYGILAEEDAQCFSVQSSIESGSFMLAAGAVLLALLNTFVVKAVTQYFRDKDELEKRSLHDEPSDAKSDHTSISEEESDGDHASQIHPVPVLFTDTFRWTLRRDDQGIDSSRNFVPESAGKQDWALPEATVVEVEEDGKYTQPLLLAVPLAEDVESKEAPELDALKTGYRLQPPVPRSMSDTDEDVSHQDIPLVLEKDVERKEAPECDALETGYRLQPPVPRPMSDTDEDVSHQDIPLVLENAVESKEAPELDALKTGYRLQPPVPRPMSDTDEDFSYQAALEQSGMEDFLTEEEELNNESNHVYGEGNNDAPSEYTEEVLEDDDYTEQSYYKNPSEEEYEEVSVEEKE